MSWALGLALVAGVVLYSASIRQVISEAAAQVTLLSVLATLPGQAAASLLCAAGLWALRPGVGYWSCLLSRMLRDASSNLPIAPPGLSTIIGARALVLSGGTTRAAIGASTLDEAAEIAAQIPFVLLAAVVLWSEWHASMALPGAGPVLLAVAGIAAALGLAVSYRKFGRHSALGVKLAEQWRKFAEELRHQRRGFPASVAFHFIAWLAGGVQIWMAAMALGYELSLFEAIAIESAAYAGRAIFFFIPAGVGTQEAGLVAAGMVFGLSPAEALALGFVLRLRDLALAAALLVWPWLEWRRRRPKQPSQ